MGKSLFARAAAGLNLTPRERAILRALDGVGITALVAAATTAAQLLSSGSLDWATIGHAALAAGVTAALYALLKYARAFGDPPLAVAPPDAPAQPPAPQAGA